VRLTEEAVASPLGNSPALSTYLSTEEGPWRAVAEAETANTIGGPDIRAAG
jgi:hypothetical protein